MVTQKQKEEIYKLFEQGFTPSQVLIKLNIPAERRIVSGCYTHYRQNKHSLTDATSKNIVTDTRVNANVGTIQEQVTHYTKLDRLNDLVNLEMQRVTEQTDKLESLLKNFMEVGEHLLECLEDDKVNFKGAERESQIDFIRQVLLHKIESGDCSESTCKQLAVISTLRRNIKNHNAFFNSIKTIEHKINDAVKVTSELLEKQELRKSGSTERFVKGRMSKIKNDTYKQILDEIMEG